MDETRRDIDSKFGSQIYMMCESRAIDAAEQFAQEAGAVGVAVPAELVRALGVAFNNVMMDSLLGAIALFGEDKIDRAFLDRIDH